MSESNEDLSLKLKNEGNAFVANQKYAEAIEKYEQALVLTPENHVLFSNMSMCFHHTGDYEKALSTANRCVELKPTFSKGHWRKAIACESLGLLNDAKESLVFGVKSVSVVEEKHTLTVQLSELVFRIVSKKYTTDSTPKVTTDFISELRNCFVCNCNDLTENDKYDTRQCFDFVEDIDKFIVITEAVFIAREIVEKKCFNKENIDFFFTLCDLFGASCLRHKENANQIGIVHKIFGMLFSYASINASQFQISDELRSSLVLSASQILCDLAFGGRQNATSIVENDYGVSSSVIDFNLILSDLLRRDYTLPFISEEIGPKTYKLSVDPLFFRRSLHLKNAIAFCGVFLKSLISEVKESELITEMKQDKISKVIEMSVTVLTKTMPFLLDSEDYIPSNFRPNVVRDLSISSSLCQIIADLATFPEFKTNEKVALLLVNYGKQIITDFLSRTVTRKVVGEISVLFSVFVSEKKFQNLLISSGFVPLLFDLFLPKDEILDGKVVFEKSFSFDATKTYKPIDECACGASAAVLSTLCASKEEDDRTRSQICDMVIERFENIRIILNTKYQKSSKRHAHIVGLLARLCIDEKIFPSLSSIYEMMIGWIVDFEDIEMQTNAVTIVANLVRDEKLSVILVTEKHIGSTLCKLLVSNANNEKLIIQTLFLLRNLCVTRSNCPILYREGIANALSRVLRFSENQVITFEAVISLSIVLRGEKSVSMCRNFLKLETLPEDYHAGTGYDPISGPLRSQSPFRTLLCVAKNGSVDPNDPSRAKIEASIRGEDSEHVQAPVIDRRVCYEAARVVALICLSCVNNPNNEKESEESDIDTSLPCESWIQFMFERSKPGKELAERKIEDQKIIQSILLLLSESPFEVLRKEANEALKAINSL